MLYWGFQNYKIIELYKVKDLLKVDSSINKGQVDHDY